MKALDCETLWSALPVPALVINRENRIDEVNSAGELFLNASQRLLKGKPLLEKVSGDVSLEAALARVRRDQGPVFINNLTLKMAHGGKQDCDVQLSPLASMDLVLMLIQPRDIAGRLGRSDAVKSAARSAIGMAEMLAHEIKNPLAGITGAAQLLSMSLTKDDQELTDLIVAESRRIVALLEQVEQFGNLRPPDREVVNIHDLLDRARKSAEVGVAAHMTFVEDYDPSLPPTFVDNDQIMQVILNLISNAAEASPGGGTITLKTSYDHALRLRRPDGTDNRLPLQIEIIDDGPGIPEELARQVFEPFVSGRENGTGLGLALVSKIISDHDGWISLDSRPNRTRIRVSLPVAADQNDGA